MRYASTKIDHANSFVIIIILSCAAWLPEIGAFPPFLAEATRELQGTHKYFREPNKLDRSPSTFLEYLTL